MQDGEERQPHCIVIGGGFAGTTAAVRLTESGFRVTLIEARERLGGRVQSLTDATTGETIDNGQHLLMGCYEAALRLLDTLGTTHLLRRQKALRVWFADSPSLDSTPNTQNSTPFSLDASRLPGKLGVALGMLMLKGLSWWEKAALLRFAVRLQLNLVRAEGKTAAQLLQEEGQSERAITRLWEPIILATLNAPVGTTSATLFVAVMRLAFLGGCKASQMLIAETGLDEVLAPAALWLEQRGSKVVSGVVSEILVENNTARGVRLKSGAELHANLVVSAVPANALLKLLPEPHRTTPFFAQFAESVYSPIVSVYLWFDRNFVEQDFIALLGTTTQWVFNRRKLCHAPKDVVERFPCHLSLTVSAAGDLASASAQTIVERCVEELHTVFPESRAATLLHSRVIRERNATPLFTPANEHLRPNPETPLHGLFLAGDWTNTGLPATIEGAARSGECAAEQAIANYSHLRASA
jgi:squalene-associated FAD-dependent desaturase